ncbi:MAG: hypothetical protein AB1656_02215 [Candidatus Omnitrophota bacterium]
MALSDKITDDLIKAIDNLPPERLAEVLDFALFLRDREQIRKWDAISDEDAFRLCEEFREEDIQWADEIAADTLRLLQQEEQA